ncbi:hypothetical protein AYI70_g6086 [Smittium culicis]|uniref:Uncharacterized protein n=1 Tax=Smittium culicis TaxID=133412 RepID=A0A1R1XRL6_9FUNG|nr:hypothetical protein AYI70_g6086 [Smittium culicis]
MLPTSKVGFVVDSLGSCIDAAIRAVPFLILTVACSRQGVPNRRVHPFDGTEPLGLISRLDWNPPALSQSSVIGGPMVAINSMRHWQVTDAVWSDTGHAQT